MSAPPAVAAAPSDYTVDKHRHRFATWAAARAAHRGLDGGTTVVLSTALARCGVADLARGAHEGWPSTPHDFDDAHNGWSAVALAVLRAAGVTEATHGRVAKLIAVYLKSMIVVAGAHDTPFGRVLHPPIDEILLRSLARSTRFSKPSRQLWRRTTWTKLDGPGYAVVIQSLRDEGLDRPAFWKVEEYWRPTNAEAG